MITKLRSALSVRRIAGFLLMTVICMTASATDIHVATTGNDANDGTESAPLLTIAKAVEKVQPGDRILIHEGTYYITERIKIPELATTPDLRCEMRAWPENAVGKVIIDAKNMKHTTEAAFKMGRCIYVNHLANYWTFYGLVLQNAEDNGMKVEGSYNIIERCTFRWNNDSGLQIGMYKDWKIEETKTLGGGVPEFNPGYKYCRYNKVINCDSYENADARTYNGADDYGDADGFACKLFPGPGTEFRGCRAWTNSDDNWDLYMVYHPVVIDHCWAYNAGRTSTGSEVGNGNGFKLGGGGSAGGAAFDQSTGAHVVTNCVAFNSIRVLTRITLMRVCILSIVPPGVMSSTIVSPHSLSMVLSISTTVLVGALQQRRAEKRLETTSSFHPISRVIRTLLLTQPSIHGLR